MCDAAKKTRAVKKAAVTRTINYIKRYVAEEDETEVKANIDSLLVKFKDFEASQEAYDALVGDDGELEVSESYFYAVQDEYIAALNLGKSWLRSQDEKSSKVKDTSKVKTLSDDLGKGDVLNLLNLPKVELEVFDGDPVKYHSFITVFDEVVDNAATDDRIKLTRLMQYTSGKAREAIRFCTLVEGGKGYGEARDILRRRFGNNHIVTDRIIHSLRHGKAVKSSEDLQQLADDLSCCYATLHQMGNLLEVESQACIVDIVSRLQTYLQIKWKKLALDVKNDTQHYPDFRELVKFMRREADDANDPVYGKLGNKPKFTQSGGESKWKPAQPVLKSATAFSASVTESSVKWKRPPCVACGYDHKLLYCPLFKEMKPIDRLQLVKNHKLCKNCLLNNHATENCKRPTVCGVLGCNEKHTKYIHVVNNVTEPIVNNVTESVVNNFAEPSCNVSGVHATEVVHDQVMNANIATDRCGNIQMPVVTVKVSDHYEVRALLDTASSSTFCTQKLVETLKVQGCSTGYILNTLDNSNEKRSKIVSLKVSSTDGEESLYLPYVYVVDKIPVMHSAFDVNLYPHLRGLPLVVSNQPVQILIGQDNSEALVPLEVKQGKKGEPFAVRTLFGWCLNGIAKHVAPIRHSVVSHFICAKSLEEKVHSLWEIENEGLTGNGISLSQDEKGVVELWDSQCRNVNGHYELPIPWKSRVHLTNNLVMAISRLKSLRLSLNKRGLTSCYDAEVKNLLALGYAEPVPLSDVHKSDLVWYLPHHAVITDKKPGKTRVVFDCAAKFHGESLNSNCHQGPDFTNKLTEVLLRFRQHSYAVTSDIEAMYNQVLIPVKDRDFLRFLWFEENGEIAHYRMTRHLFGGIWCSSAASYALRRTVIDGIDLDPLIADTVMHSFYVDDCLKSVSTRDEALTVIHGTKKLLAESGFNLTKFVTNDPQILLSIPDLDRAKEFKELCPDSRSKALGINWNVMDDIFYFEAQHSALSSNVTRRKMLSTVASVFDPLGLVSPVVITGKLLFQEATRLQLCWDSVVPSDIQTKWNDWLCDLNDLTKIHIPRCVKPSKFDDFFELHHFSDASQKAYGCCSYLRTCSKDGDLHVALLLSKCKVAPLKQITVPRLELQAAVLAAKVDQLLRQQLQLELAPSHFWVDSEIVLKYIYNEKRKFHVFVGNHVGVIRQLTHPAQWHYIAGCENPADVISRGQRARLFDVGRWSKGPKFLWKTTDQWSVSTVSTSLSENDPEVKVESRVQNHVCLLLELDKDLLLDLFKRYSSWYRLKRAVAWLLRFKNFIRNGRTVVQKGPLTVCEIEEAELAILKCSQSQFFVKDIQKLSKGKSVDKSSSLHSFDPYLDHDGLLRVGGRIKHANVSVHQKHPYIVSHDHPIALLIAREQHNIAHVGTLWVTSQIRQRYWITRIHQIVKQVARDCFVCKKLFHVPCVQKMASLPAERLESGHPPFYYVGIDCFGPFIIKQGRSEVKRYGCVFTCLNTRAVHFEKLNSLDTDSFLNGFRRFVCRRGCPVKVWSDNGTNFVGGQSELSKNLNLLDKNRIESYGVSKGITWHFNPPHASHMGGIWERMIRTFRKVFTGICPNHIRLSDESLESLFCEVEFIINSRPITKVSDDIKDPCALTPNHLLLLREHPSLAPGLFHGADLYKRRWRCVQHLADQFWHRWTREYLHLLQSRCKWTGIHDNVSVGDLVLIKEENTPRGVWPMGIVQDVYPGSDGLVRSVRVRTKANVLTRPIIKVVLLEGSL